MQYTIKNNVPLPHFTRHALQQNLSEGYALKEFSDMITFLEKQNIKVFLRNDHKKPMRGQIQVEIDGFFYYVELFKTK